MEQQSSISITFDGTQVYVTKKGLNNMQAIALLATASGIMMKETLGDIKVGKQGEIVAADVPWRPGKTA